MEQLRQWAEPTGGGKLPPGIDLFLTVVSGDFYQVGRPRCSWRPCAGTRPACGKSRPSWTRSRKPSRWRRPVLLAQSTARRKLSVIADAGVREIGMFGLPASGREFDLPYKKSLHITKTPFSKDFCDQFVDLVDAVYEHEA